MAPAESIREFIGKNTLHPARNGKSNTRPDGYLIPQARWLEIEGA